MRNDLRIFGFLVAVLMTVCAFAQASPSSATQGVPILRGAALPVYPPIAKAAHVTGRVMVRVTVESGLVVKTEVLSRPDVTSGGRFLELATVENLKTWSFGVDVTGAFTVTYTYEISGTETDNPTNEKVEMLPSLDVRVTGRPVKPTVMCEKQGSISAESSRHEGVDHAKDTSTPLTL